MSARGLHPPDDSLSERGRVLVRDAVCGVAAPHSLRERVEAERARTRPARRRRWFVLGGAVAAVAAAALLALTSPGGAPGGPSVVEAAALTSRVPTGSPPPVDARNPSLLRRSVQGVTFPAYSSRYGLRASGQRVDRIAGRRAVTVFYDAPDGIRIGYTIVGGGALDEPEGGARGAEHYVARRDGRIFVTWRRGGRTCVLGAPASIGEARMLALSS